MASKFPNPEDVQKEFEDFVKQRFGDTVQVFTGSVNPQNQDTSESVPTPDKSYDDILSFKKTPKEVKEFLDQYVIQQDEAKKTLAIAVCDHYNHIKNLQQNKISHQDYAKQNVLLLGPTGVGKTYMIRKVAELIGVPFVKADATRFSETGYVGANVDDLVRDLVTQADGDIERAQYGIIYLDEVDKLANSPGKMGRDVTGRGVQFGLLRLMENADVDLKSGNDVQSQIQAMMEFQSGKKKKSVINTANILFIVSGAFTELEKIISKRLNTNAIGFGSKQERSEDENTLRFANTQDLIDFGFEPEFVGRLPVRVACNHLTKHDLYRILKESQGSLVHQYTRAFNAYGIDVEFQDRSLMLIAERAHQSKTGARAIISVFEELLRDFKYHLPGSHIISFDVTPELIQDPQGYLKKLLVLPDNRAFNLRMKDILEFEAFYKEKFEIQITFSQKAAEGIASRAIKKGISVHDLCLDLLKSYDHGLKLIEQNTGTTRFEIDDTILVDPTKLLETLIGRSFQKTVPPTFEADTD